MVPIRICVGMMIECERKLPSMVYSLFHDDMRKRIGIERLEFYVIYKHLYVSLDGL